MSTKIASGAPGKPHANDEAGSRAPFIYFDLASAHGVHNGSVQIDLAAFALAPSPEIDPHASRIPTARLRCSRQAALSLRRSIDQALDQLGFVEIVFGRNDYED